MLRAAAAFVLFQCTCTALAALGSGYDFGIDVSRWSRRRDAASPIVVGKLPLALNGSIPRRLEVRQLKADPYKWDLFILALSMLQNADQDDPLSWYQIAGGLSSVIPAMRQRPATLMSLLLVTRHPRRAL